MPGAAIVADKLSKWFGHEEARTYAVTEVSFEANWGEMLYIVEDPREAERQLC